jgi:hypothetical protein
MTIRCVYEQEPNFPATDQHPDAVRHKVGRYWVDAVGGKPSEGDVTGILSPKQPDRTPLQRLTAFLNANPDVQDLIDGK